MHALSIGGIAIAAVGLAGAPGADVESARRAAPRTVCAATNWIAAAPVPGIASRYGFAQVGDNFYVITVPTLHRYSVLTDTWSTLAPMPRGLLIPGVAHYDGKLYVVGGHDDGLTNSLFIYDIATNTWSDGPTMPVFSYGSAAGAFDGKIYAIVGTTWQMLAIYDIAGQSWTLGPNVPSGCRLAAWTQVGPYLYLIGGLSTGCSAVSRRLDMSAVTWSTGPAWTPGRGDFALASDGVKLYAMGGRAPTESVPSAEVYELDLASWPGGAWTRRMPDLPSPREANQAGFNSNGRVWSTGGYGAGQVHTSQHLYLGPDPSDVDQDGIVDVCDNCPFAANAAQDDLDGDNAGQACDCDDGDPAVWRTPGEADGVIVTRSAVPNEAVLFWDAVAQSGAAMVTYDTLRSPTGTDFDAAASCVETADGSDLTASDLTVLESGEGAFFLIRARNGCPGLLGTGPIGTASSGAPRAVRSCP